MKGNIYTDDRCPVCQGRLRHDANKGKFICEKHPKSKMVVKNFIVKQGRKHFQRFKSYKEAERHLVGIRFKADEGTFDPRDYKKDNPLGVESQVREYLKFKGDLVKGSTLQHIKHDLNKAVEFWGPRNIKTIRFADLQDFLYGLKVSGKTRFNARGYLHSFFKWVSEREGLAMPRFPDCKEYTLGWRNTIDLELQLKIIDEVKRISYDINPKIWLGIKWLARYIAFRPREMAVLRERDVDMNGIFICRPETTKEKKVKFIPIVDEDLKLIAEMRAKYPALPDMPFFRHLRGGGKAKKDTAFATQYFYKWWKKACDNIGVEGVDLYGGTRHSTTTALSADFSKEFLKEYGTMHSTNKAFDRYMQSDNHGSKKVFQRIDKHYGKVIGLHKFKGDDDEKDSKK